MTRLKAFRALGTKPRNRYRSLSARSADGKTVAVSLWKDRFQGPAGKMVYSRAGWGDWNLVTGRLFIQDLLWALGNCGGLVKVAVVVRDPARPQPRTADCYPANNLLMRVTHVDPVTGAFRLE